jgi:GntR family transcriptional regulator
MVDEPKLRVQPLYRQVYDRVIEQIVAGGWKPGTPLPSEQALSEQLGVSPGTVRRALDELANNNVVERRQGRGTFVAKTSESRSILRFFRLCYPDGRRVTPTAANHHVRRRIAHAEDISRLHLAKNAEVIETKRVRIVDGRAVISEKIVVAAAMFQGLERRKQPPNTLYSLYQSVYGISVGSVEEQLRADRANAEDRRRLGVDVGTPLLHIDRIAISIDGTTLVEWRVSRCCTSHFVYTTRFS